MTKIKRIMEVMKKSGRRLNAKELSEQMGETVYYNQAKTAYDRLLGTGDLVKEGSGKNRPGRKPRKVKQASRKKTRTQTPISPQETLAASKAVVTLELEAFDLPVYQSLLDTLNGVSDFVTKVGGLDRALEVAQELASLEAQGEI